MILEFRAFLFCCNLNLDFKEPEKTEPVFKISIIIPYYLVNQQFCISHYRLSTFLKFFNLHLPNFLTSLFPADRRLNPARRASSFSQLPSFQSSQLPSFPRPLSNRASILTQTKFLLRLETDLSRNPLSVRASILTFWLPYHSSSGIIVAIPYQLGHQF